MAFFKNLVSTATALYKVDLEVFAIQIKTPKEVAAYDQIHIEWRRGPQTDSSHKVQIAPSEDGTINFGAKFTRISNFRYNSKMQI